MPKLALFLLAACSLTVAGQTTKSIAVPVEASMPREKVEATFKDPRVLAFLKNAMEGFKVSCISPDPGSTKAKVTLPNIPKDAPPDASGFASTWYEVTLPCSNVMTATVKAEFTPLTGDRPLNLVLSLRQELKQ